MSLLETNRSGGKMPDDGPSQGALTTQLSELNARSRTYVSRLWQLPLGYAAAAAIALTMDGGTGVRTAVAGILGVIGILILSHMCFGLTEATLRAVAEIRRIEQKLKLHKTAKWKPKWYLRPMIGIVGVIALAEFVYAGWLLLVCV